MDPTKLIDEIKQLIIEELDLREVKAADIADDAPLFGSGLGLDSLDALQLAMAVEERYGVEIPEDDRAKEIFASVAALTKHIVHASSNR